MELDSDKKYKNIVKFINFVLLIIICALLVWLIYSSYFRHFNFSVSRESFNNIENQNKSNINSNKIWVDIGGAVINPGVYEMNEGDRVVHLIEKAGGLKENANLYFIDKELNKAQKLYDGLKIYIPYQDEDYKSLSLNNSFEDSNSRLINVNSASKELLMQLPGIGEVTANKIIQNRPYKSIEDLINKKVINSSQKDKIKDLITF